MIEIKTKNKILASIVILLMGVGAILSYMNEVSKVELIYLKSVKALTEGSYEPRSSDLDPLIGTPMEDAIPFIRRSSEYYNLPESLYVGIANAESSLKNFKCYNPWGIDTGKGNDPRCYTSWEHAVNGFSQLLKYYYFQEGRITPEQLKMKYVGWDNPHWVGNVKVYYDPEIIIKY
jgi:hypothetical protein